MNFSNNISVLIFVKLGCPLILPYSFLCFEGKWYYPSCLCWALFTSKWHFLNRSICWALYQV